MSSIRRYIADSACFDCQIWKVLVEEESGKVAKIEYVSSLSRHTKAVNVVRFSPCGKSVIENCSI